MSTNLSPTAGDTLAETYTRAIEPEPSVTITDATFFGHGWQPTTIAVLQAIWFMPQGVSFGVEDLATWFGRLGWRSVNGRPFGVEGVRRELALIRKAGYIQANRLRGDGGKVTGIRYEVSKRVRAELQPAGAWIPIQGSESQTPSSDHVPLPTGDGGQPDKVAKQSPRSHHVPSPTGHGGRPEMVARSFPQVAPCAVGKPNPPHPPEEEVTTSSIHEKRHSRGAGASPGGTDTEPSVTVEQQQAAAAFLMRLPGPWAVGRLKAKNLSVELARAVAETGWDLDMSLKGWLTRKEDGKAAPRSHVVVLEYRVKNLELREAVFAAADETAASPAPKGGIADWCGQCNHGEKPLSLLMRTVADPDPASDRVDPCPRCHPSATRAA